MSGHSKNRQGTMKAFREMAADLCQAKVGRRWRWTVRAIAREQGWIFMDAFLWSMSGGLAADPLIGLTMRRSPLLDKLEARA